MWEKVKLELFGLHENWSCSNGLGNIGTKTVSQSIHEFLEYFERCDVRNKVNVELVDVAKDELRNYSAVKKMLSDGYPLPYIQINGEMVCFGYLPQRMIYDIVKSKLVQRIDKEAI